MSPFIHKVDGGYTSLTSSRDSKEKVHSRVHFLKTITFTVSTKPMEAGAPLPPWRQWVAEHKIATSMISGAIAGGCVSACGCGRTKKSSKNSGKRMERLCNARRRVQRLGTSSRPLNQPLPRCMMPKWGLNPGALQRAPTSEIFMFLWFLRLECPGQDGNRTLGPHQAAVSDWRPAVDTQGKAGRWRMACISYLEREQEQV